MNPTSTVRGVVLLESTNWPDAIAEAQSKFTVETEVFGRYLWTRNTPWAIRVGKVEVIDP